MTARKYDKEDEFELNKLEFEKSLAQRNYEIDKFWQRGWFFGGLLLAIASGYFGVTKDKDYSIFIAFLGFLVSLSQSLMNRGSKYWQERWEIKTKNSESVLGIDVTKTRKLKNERYYLDSGTLAKDENFFAVARRFSVSKLTILVWDLLTIFWGFLWIENWNFDIHAKPRIAAIIIHGLIILYIIFFFINGKVYERLIKKKDADSHKNNVREPFYTDSENYVENNLDYLNKS